MAKEKKITENFIKISNSWSMNTCMIERNTRTGKWILFWIEIQSKLAKKLMKKKMPLIEIFHTLIDSTATIILMFRISLSPFILFFFCSIQIIDQVTMREKEKKFNFFNEKKNFFDWFTSKLKTFKPHKMCVCVCECCLWWWWWCIMWIWLCDFFFWLFFNWNSINIINNIKIIHEFLLIWGKNAIGTYRSYTTHNYTHTERKTLHGVCYSLSKNWLINL